MSADFQCAVAAVERGEPMFATGSQVANWLLVEVRGAWGDDAVHDSALGDQVPDDWKDQLKQRGIRVVCIRTHARRQVDGVRMFTCAARRSADGRDELWGREVESLAEVEAIAADLDPSEPGSGWTRVDQPLYLVCTNGRHDQCCANLGRPLIRAIRETPWADRVWESSHVGGDRFAPNVVAFPQSIYFGRVDPTAAPELLAAFDRGRLDLARFRGRTSLSFAEQAVEHFVRREFDVDHVDGVRVGRRDDGSYPVVVRDRDSERRVRVQIRRRLIVVDEPLTCGGPSGQRAPVFELVSIRDEAADR